MPLLNRARSRFVSHTHPALRWFTVLSLACALLFTAGSTLFTSVFAAPPVDCAPRSPLTCDKVPVIIPFALTFDGTENGLVDADGQGTGFTMVDPPTARLATDPAVSNAAARGYEASLLDVTGGQLKVTTASGIQFKKVPAATNTNSLINGLGVGIDVPAEAIRIDTEISDPPTGSGQSEQAGLWFGLDEDNYIKLAIVSVSNNLYKVQMLQEINGNVGSTAELNSATTSLVSDTIRLSIIIDPATKEARGLYKINNEPEQSIGMLAGVPATFINGKLLEDGTTGPVSFAGIFATDRNRSVTPATLIYSFDRFNVGPAVPPAIAAPSNVTATAGDSEVTISWNAVPEATSYNVYRSTTSPVTKASSLVSTSPLTATTYVDAPLNNGTVYYYAVSAVNNASAESQLSAQVSAVPDVAETPTFEFPVQINFQNEAAEVPEDYTKDFGKPYTNLQGFGWVREDSLNGTHIPADLVGNGRDRNNTTSPNQLLDTLMHMQAGQFGSFNGVTVSGAWEVALTPGVYSVTVSVGDASVGNDTTIHNINLEGTKVLSYTTKPAGEAGVTGDARWTTGSDNAVTVTDGRLTVDALGGTNTKINYIIIDKVSDITVTPTAEPTGEPTAEPTGEPTAEPTGEPTAEPTGEPTAEPTGEPTAVPTTPPGVTPTPVTPIPTPPTAPDEPALYLPLLER